MFSYIHTKFQIPPVQAEKPFKVETDIIASHFAGGKKFGEICTQEDGFLSSIAAEWATAQTNPVIWLSLEKNDVDPGRFWTLLVMAMQPFRPDIGNSVLNTMIDHHANPPVVALNRFANELADFDFVLVLDGVQHVAAELWWQSFITWLQGLKSQHQCLFLNYGQQYFSGQNHIELPLVAQRREASSALIQEWSGHLDPDVRLTLTAVDRWWLPWLNERFAGTFNSQVFDALQNSGLLSPQSDDVILPSLFLQNNLRSNLIAEDFGPITSEIREMAAWLDNADEGLESIRFHLLVKDYELAADLFERKAVSWLNQGVDPLTILFWLKEMPGILLTSRTVLSWLVAVCSKQLGFSIQVKTYLDLAENNLMSLNRFTRSEEQWRTIPITEDGLTVGEMLQRIENLREE